MTAADFPDWTRGTTVFGGVISGMTAADFPDWTDGITVVDHTVSPTEDFPDWTKVVSQVPGIIPPNPSLSLTAWYDATKLTGLSDSANVTSWADSSGNGFTLNTPGSPDPSYKLDGINNLSCVAFAGSRIGEAANHSTPSTVTCAGVIQASTGTMGIVGPGNGNWQFAISGGDWTMLAAGNLNTLTFPVSNQTSPHSFVCQWDLAGGTWTMYIDGTQVATGNEGGTTVSFNTVYYLGNAAQIGEYTGLIGETLIYNTILSPTDVASVYSYLKAKWGTP